MKRLLITITLLASGVLSANARGWTMDECVGYAVENNPQTTIQQIRNESQNQTYKEAIAQLLPSLSASTNANFSFGRSLDPKTNTYTDVNSFSNGYGASTSITLFHGFYKINNIRMQKVNNILGKQLLQQRKDDVAYATMGAFFTVLYYQELTKLAAEQLERSAGNLRQAERMAELGMKELSDVAEMQAQYASDNYNLTRQKNSMVIAVIKLKEKMNFPIEEELSIETYVPESEETYCLRSPLDIYHNALDFIPGALVAESNLKSEEFSLKLTRASLTPTLSLNGGMSTSFSRYMDESDYLSFAEQFKNRRGQNFGFSLSIPVFSGFSRYSNVKRSKNRLRIARIEKESSLRSLYSEIEQAVADMNGTADQYTQAIKQAEAASMAHNANQRRYEEGLISPLELHASANRLMQARIEQENARLTYYLKRKMVDYYNGEPLYTE